jgi:predicted dehydrogenase/threonine dehydrogenase-like Zn-dependent dehydrogenase
MKQLLQNLRTGETEVVEVPAPQPKPGTALVRTAASLVSAGTERMLVDFASKSLLGKARSRPDLARQVVDKARREGVLTTLESAFNRLEQPLPLGYSSAGTIIDLGEGLQNFKVGQRVACAGGGYAVHAEYALVPQNLMAGLPDHVNFESGAFATLGAIALHGFRLADPGIGEQVAVIGLGLLGLLAVGIANAAGCSVLAIDLDPQRVELAKIMSANTAVLREEAESAAQRISRGRGCDSVLICADTPSSDPVELAGSIARDRANVVAIGAVGLEIPRKIYFEKELSFINSRSYGPGRYDPAYEEGGQDYPIGYVRWTEGRNLEAFIDLLSSGRVDANPLISHRIPIEEALQAYELITKAKDQQSLGIILTYGPGDDQMGAIQDDSNLRDPKPVIADTTPRAVQTATLKLGVLGAGNFATAVMLPAIKKSDGIELVGIASSSGLSAQTAANRFGIGYATSDGNRILDDASINTVAILTRHNLHTQQVIAALGAGKHVFCEKPLAINSQELDRIIMALTSNGGTGPDGKAAQEEESKPLLTVGFNRRYAPFAQKLKDFIGEDHDPLVAHYRVNAGALPLTHWLHDPEQGGGRIIGEGCHFIDILTFLVGEPPSSIFAVALPDDGRYRQDNVQLSLTFPDGSIGTIIYLAVGDKAFPKERLEVFTAGKVGVIEDFRTLELVQNGKRKSFHSRLRQDKGHHAQWAAFRRAVTETNQAPIPYRQLIGVTRTSFAAIEALRTGEKIDIPSEFKP